MIKNKQIIPINTIILNLLTIAFGPEHHDLPIYRVKNEELKSKQPIKTNDDINLNKEKIKKEQIGRISFDITFSQVGKVNISIERMILKLNRFMNNNEISMTLSLINPSTHEYYETEHTTVIKSLNMINTKTDQEITFEWDSSDSNELKLSNKTIWTDLKKSYININLFEPMFLITSIKSDIEEASSLNSSNILSKEPKFYRENINELKEREKVSDNNDSNNDIDENIENNEDHEIIEDIEEEGVKADIVKTIDYNINISNDVSSPPVSISKKVASSNTLNFNVPNFKNSNNKLFDECIIKRKQSMFSKIDKNSNILRKTVSNNGILEEIYENAAEVEVKRNYKHHGIVEIHLNEVLEKEDNKRIQQYSQIFQNMSRHYKKKANYILNELDKDYFKLERKNSHNYEENHNNIIKNDFNFVELEKRNSASIKKLESEDLYNLENYTYSELRKYSVQNNNGVSSDLFGKMTEFSINKKYSINSCEKENTDYNCLKKNESKYRSTDALQLVDLLENSKLKFNTNFEENNSLGNCKELDIENKISTPLKKSIGNQNNTGNLNINKSNSNNKKRTSCLIKNNSKEIEKNDIQNLNVKTISDFNKHNLEEKIFYKGEMIGSIVMDISLKHLPFIKQIHCGVHTEKGFDSSSHYLLTYKAVNKEIAELSKIYSILFSKLSDSAVIKTIYSLRENNKEIKNMLIKLKAILNSTVRENSLVYHYNSPFEILEIQQILIKLSTDMTGFFDTVTVEIKTLFFSCLETILSRLELDLELLFLDVEHINKYNKLKEEKENNNKLSNIETKNLSKLKKTATLQKDISKINSDNIIEYVDTKVKIASDYILLLHELLSYSLENINRRVHDEASKNFYETVLAFCYFRIGEFREEFLKTATYGLNNLCVFSEQSLSIDDLDVPNHIKRKSMNLGTIKNAFTSLFDWESIFFEKYKLFDSFEYLNKINSINQIICKEEWREKIKKKGLIFFSISAKIKKIVKGKIMWYKNIKWKDIPGFTIILDLVYHELVSKDLKAMSSSCITLMKGFINDSNIINKFVHAIITKVNVYDTVSVNKFFDILNSFFREHEEVKCISNFAYKLDYNLIKKSFKIILKSDNFLSIRKLLWFLYNNAHLINIDALSEILDIVLSEYFFIIFFHWSFQVRNMFYYFCLFIINHKLRVNFKKEFIQNEQSLNNKRNSLLLDMIKSDNNEGFFNIVKLDYFDKVKNAILGEFYSKLRIINLIKVKIFKSLINFSESNNSILSDKDEGSDKIKSYNVITNEYITNIYENLTILKKKEFIELIPSILEGIIEDKGILSTIDKEKVLHSIIQFVELQDQFKIWEKESKLDIDNIQYPKLDLKQLKDDFFEFTD